MKKGLKIGIIIVIVIAICSFIFRGIDKKRADNNKRPLFMIRTAVYNDGVLRNMLA